MKSNRVQTGVTPLATRWLQVRIAQRSFIEASSKVRRSFIQEREKEAGIILPDEKIPAVRRLKSNINVNSQLAAHFTRVRSDVESIENNPLQIIYDLYNKHGVSVPLIYSIRCASRSARKPGLHLLWQNSLRLPTSPRMDA